MWPATRGARLLPSSANRVSKAARHRREVGSERVVEGSSVHRLMRSRDNRVAEHHGVLDGVEVSEALGGELLAQLLRLHRDPAQPVGIGRGCIAALGADLAERPLELLASANPSCHYEACSPSRCLRKSFSSSVVLTRRATSSSRTSVSKPSWSSSRR